MFFQELFELLNSLSFPVLLANQFYSLQVYKIHKMSLHKMSLHEKKILATVLSISSRFSNTDHHSQQFISQINRDVQIFFLTSKDNTKLKSIYLGLTNIWKLNICQCLRFSAIWFFTFFFKDVNHLSKFNICTHKRMVSKRIIFFWHCYYCIVIWQFVLKWYFRILIKVTWKWIYVFSFMKIDKNIKQHLLQD